MRYPSKARARLTGITALTRSLVGDPHLVSELPSWIRKAKRRHDPLVWREPWWNFKAIAFVKANLGPGARVFEYGGGASTLWLLDLGCRVRTIEHDAHWHHLLTDEFTDSNPVELIPTHDDYAAYVDSISTTPDGSLDLVILDGRRRVRCGLASMSKIRPGGMILLDDADRPRYRPLHEALTGWDGHHLRGLKTGDWAPCQTSVWFRPQG